MDITVHSKDKKIKNELEEFFSDNDKKIENFVKNHIAEIMILNEQGKDLNEFIEKHYKEII